MMKFLLRHSTFLGVFAYLFDILRFAVKSRYPVQDVGKNYGREHIRQGFSDHHLG